MQQLRNLNKFLLVGKVLRKRNRKATFELTQKRLVILTTIFYMEIYTIRTGFRGIYGYLDSIGRTIHWSTLKKDLDVLRSAHYIEKSGTTYRVSVLGKVLLFEMEEKLKKARFV